MIKHDIDPTGKAGMSREECREWAGLLPYWAANASQAGMTTAEGTLDILAKHYGFPASVHHDGELSEEGRYDYPGDPPLYPLVVCHVTDDVRIFIYLYGLLSVHGPDGDFHTRMD